MKNYSNYEMVKHSKDEHLNCFGWSFYCDFWSIYDNGNEIGRLYEDGGDAEFKGHYFSAEENKRALRIELKELRNDGMVVYVPHTGEYTFVGEKKIDL